MGYGDGLFETIAIRDGRCRMLDRHLARLERGCSVLGIDVLDSDAIATTLRNHARQAGEGTLRLTLTRGSGPRGYAPPPESNSRRIVALYPPGPKSPAAIDCMICETPVGSNSKLAGLKTLGRTEHVLARQECEDAGMAEGLMFDDAGVLVCGTMSNVFIVTGGQLQTPMLDRSGVAGIVRDLLFEILPANGVSISEARIYAAELETADEIILTNALTGARVVKTLDGRPIREGAVGRQIRSMLASLGYAECEDSVAG